MAASDTGADGLLRIAVPPSRCISAVDALGWEAALAVRAGRYVLGVRGDTPDVTAQLRELLADRLVDVADVARNLSVALGAAGDAGPVADLHRLHLGHHRAVRSRDPRRVLRALDGYLDAHDRVFTGGTALVLATAVVADGRAHLLDHTVRQQVVDDERRWRDDGFDLVDRPWVDVDLDAGDLVVPTPVLPLDGAAGRAGDGDRSSGGVGPGRYPIASWSPWPTPETAGVRLQAVATRLVNLPDLDAASALPALRDLLARTPARAEPMRVDAEARRALLAT